MAVVGAWGSIIRFSVSDRRILTFKDLKQSSKVNTQAHKVISGKPIVQFLAPDLSTISMTISLDASLCHHPIRYLDTLNTAMQSGIYAPFVVGGRVLLQQAMLTELSTAYNIIMRNGEIYSFDVDVSMTEYN